MVCDSLKRRFCLVSAILAVLLAAGGCAEDAAPGPETVFIGVLLPLTGNLSSAGEASKVAVELAIEDVNANLAAAGANLQIGALLADTGTDPGLALQQLRDLSEQGIKIFIGPMSSDAVSTCKPFADRVGLLLISHASTAPTLSIANDNLFRFVPDDTVHAPAVVELMFDDGIDAVVFFAREGVWGEDLCSLVAARFADRGGTVVGSVAYDPSSFSASDFRDELAELSAFVAQAAADFGADRVAVHLLCYDEGMQIFKQAALDPVLSTVRWYGTDGMTLNSELPADSAAAAFASTVEFVSPVIGDRGSEQFGILREEIEELLGRATDNFAIVAYDAVWTAAITISQVADPSDAAILVIALPQVAAAVEGITGRILLNNAGDRLESGGGYDFWSLVKEAGVYSWQRVATYEDGEIHPAPPSEPADTHQGES